MRLTLAQAYGLADKCFDVADEAPDNEVVTFISDCCDNPAGVGSGIAAFETKLTDKVSGDGVGFDPVTIIAIITAIVQMVQGCFNPKPATLRRRFGNRVRVALAIYRQANYA